MTFTKCPKIYFQLFLRTLPTPNSWTWWQYCCSYSKNSDDDGR